MNKLFLLLLLLVPTAALAASVTFTWDANSEANIVNYKLYCATVTTPPYTWVATTNTVTITAPLDVSILSNYCAVTAVNDWGLESDYSNTVRVFPNVKPATPKNFRRQ
jgi:hypothetical protein